MRKNKEEKYTLTIRMDDEIKQEIQERMDNAHVRSLNAFVLRAIEFYLGYLRQGKNLNYISPILASSIKGEMKNIEHNLSEIIFKAAVQLSTGKSRTQRIVIYYRFVGYVEIPEVSRRQHIKADTRKGVAVEYLTDPLPA